MSDDKLLHALRNSKGWPTLGNAAADRIEELEAEIARLREVLKDIASPPAYGMRPEDRIEAIRDAARDALQETSND